MSRFRKVAAAFTAAAAVAAVATPTGARVTPVIRTTIALDRLAYHDAVHRARFETSGLCVTARDALATEGPCRRGSVRGTIGSARLGFDAQRFVEAVPTDVPVLQTPAVVTEQLVRVDIYLVDAGAVRVAITARDARGVAAAPVEGSASEGGRVEGRSVVWNLGVLEPGDYEMTARFSLSNDPELAASFVPEVSVEKTDTSTAVAEHFRGRVGTDRPVRRVHRLRLLQHVAGPAGAPAIHPGTPYPDADAALPQAWGAMPGYVGRGAYFDPAAGALKAVTHDLEDLSPGARGRANVASMGWTYWSPQPGPKVEPVAGFAYRRGDLTGFEIGLKTAGFLRYGVIPQTPGPIYDGDAGTIAVTASAGAVHTRARRTPDRPGGRLHAAWDGSAAEAWTDLGQTSVPMAEPNASSPASSTFTEPSVLAEAGVQVFARGGDVDNRSGKRALTGEPIVLGGRWDFAALGTAAPPEARYRPRFRSDGSRLTIIPAVAPGGYMLENGRSGWLVDWSAFHFLGWLELAPHRHGKQVLVKTFAFPSGVSGRIDVLVRGRVHEVFHPGPGVWQVTVTRDDVDLVRLGRLR